MMVAGSLSRWWRLPVWLFALVTGSKSFIDNPILGSPRLNRAGLHALRIRGAHAVARWRRARIAPLLSADLREQFDRDGFIIIRNVLPSEDFRALTDAVMRLEVERREQQQGDTITGRIAVGPRVLAGIPALAGLLNSRWWCAAMAYVASARSTPLYYLQTIAGGVAEGSPDPQLQLHSDTFHPSMKAWLFLTDVDEDDRPLTYVAGSHRLTPARIAWEHRKSIEVLSEGDRLSQRGSLRISADELTELGLSAPIRFCVPANTLVIADTCGFHARADSHRPSLRIELWAYCRPSPFVPWLGGGPLSWKPIAPRRMQWLSSILDELDRRGWAKQHWRNAGRGRLSDLAQDFHQTFSRTNERRPY